MEAKLIQTYKVSSNTRNKFKLYIWAPCHICANLSQRPPVGPTNSSERLDDCEIDGLFVFEAIWRWRLKQIRDYKPIPDFDFCVNPALLHWLASKYPDQTVCCIRTYLFVAGVCNSHGLASPFENAGKTLAGLHFDDTDLQTETLFDRYSFRFQK